MDAQYIVLREQISYPVTKTILKNLPIEKRGKLVKRCPSIRKVNKKIPYHLKVVCLLRKGNTYTIQLDTFKWKFTVENQKVIRFVNPNGVSFDCEMPISRVNDLVSYYLNRGESRVGKFEIDNFHLGKKAISVRKIGSLKLKFSVPTEVESLLSNFQNTEIGLLFMLIDHLPEEPKWVHELEKICCHHLKITTRWETSDDLFNGLPFKKLEIRENRSTEQKVRNMYEKFRKGKHENGSCYYGIVGPEAAVAQPGEQFLDELKREVQVEKSYKTFFTSKLENPNRELVVEKIEYPTVMSEIFAVHVAESGTWRWKILEHTWISRLFTVLRCALKNLMRSNRLMSVYLLLATLLSFSTFGLIGLFHSRLEFYTCIGLFFLQLLCFLVTVLTILMLYPMISQMWAPHFPQRTRISARVLIFVQSAFYFCCIVFLFMTTLQETQVFRLF